ncbi:DUF4906 domain-containing protein [Alistipes shahii]|mgnify:FL=1|uniref:DUF4906 domain-containing protein n=1 Tax=Alistipes shahii TaxID=328814 RepID=UPI002674C143|nr:DUF4906 domain-containing protein [Alistipes shahii]
MKYLLFTLLSLTVWLTGCIHDKTAADAPIKNVSVEVGVTARPAERITRATDEMQIKDLNVYLFGKTNTFKLHIYTQSPLLQFECPVGEYDLYIAANLHADMADLSPAELEACTIASRPAYDDLPMSAKTTVTIAASAQGKVVTLPSIQVRRCVAKIAYNIRVDNTVSDIELQSVRLMNIPRTSPLFTSAQPSENKADYTSGFYSEIPPSGNAAYSGVCYVFENMQGCVPGITSQADKSILNAPENASYLLIRAVRGDKVLSYSIYLGENNTDNFDVERNTHQTFNITIRGDNEVDTRISSYTLNVYDTYADNMIGGYCTYDVMGELFVEVDGNTSPLTLRGRITASQGDTDRILVDDVSIGAGLDLELMNQPGLNEYFFYYDKPVYTSANSQIAYTVTIEDDGGYAQSYDFERRFANKLYIRVETADNGKGKVNVSQALYSAAVPGTRDHIAMCYEMGCTLVALPAAGYRFEGWYTTDGYTKRLSASTTYFYRPESTDASIFPKFTAATFPLDENGTANCYITPKLNTSYSFNATVQGNGKNTKNIWALNLNGISARMLWESDSKVVENVLYADSRISFSTGNARGNAVIGLFDITDNCIWSWHIWSVDYDPASTAQTYVSGAVFMDRNLGAITTDCTQPASRGLYYQWGRKDPFIHPASCNSDERERVVYTEGFAFNVSYPRNAGTESPYDVMTVEWSIAHPTTFMSDAMYEDWEEWTSVVDWLYNHHPNLWGNVTTSNNNISKVSLKSIYDPCPVGWKVPSPEDFAGIERVSQSSPYYVTIHYNGNRTTNIPIGGTFVETRFMNNGQLGRLYTNAPYYMHWGTWACRYGDISCTSIIFSTGSVPSFIDTSDYYRYAANPIRCIRE